MFVCSGFFFWQLFGNSIVQEYYASKDSCLLYLVSPFLGIERNQMKQSKLITKSMLAKK